MSPNPSGSNQFHQPEPKYGYIKKKAELTKAAPMSGAPTPAVTTPQRAQAQAVSGGRRKPSNAKKAASGTPPPYHQELAATWAQIAATPGASPLVQEIARRAIAQAQNAPS